MSIIVEQSSVWYPTVAQLNERIGPDPFVAVEKIVKAVADLCAEHAANQVRDVVDCVPENVTPTLPAF